MVEQGFTCKGSLDDFWRIRYSYRAEIEYEGTVYKLWCEHDNGIRLEKFEPTQLEPYEITVIPKGGTLTLPNSIWESEQWTIFAVVRINA